MTNTSLRLPIRVRVAPSPTGLLHIGTARTALFNWLFAKQKNGTFIVRIEDTDTERSRPEYEKDIIDGISWLGLSYDEFYRQKERHVSHAGYLKQLLSSGKAFYCAHTKEELEREFEAQRNAKEPPRHICAQRDEHRSSGIIRLKNDAREPIIITDIIRGSVTFDPTLFGDFSLARSIDDPLYNFVVVVDDFEMNISHVIRGEDHLSNTPKQILLYNALGLSMPQWAHIPLLLGLDRSKLSKRHGAVSLMNYRSAGYLPDAMVNFMALLGWHPKDDSGEILDRDMLIHEFSLERIQKSGAIVSHEKLNWLNHEYIKKIPTSILVREAHDFIPQSIPSESLIPAIDALRTRVATLKDLGEEIYNIFTLPEYRYDVLLWKGKIPSQEALANLDSIIELLSSINPTDFTQKRLEAILAPLTEKRGKGSVLWPLRAALSGREASLGPYELGAILGKSETQRRLSIARDLLVQNPQ